MVKPIGVGDKVSYIGTYFDQHIGCVGIVESVDRFHRVRFYDSGRTLPCWFTELVLVDSVDENGHYYMNFG